MIKAWLSGSGTVQENLPNSSPDDTTRAAAEPPAPATQAESTRPVPPSNDSRRQPPQYHLIDLFGWMTVVALTLGMGCWCGLSAGIAVWEVLVVCAIVLSIATGRTRFLGIDASRTELFVVLGILLILHALTLPAMKRSAGSPATRRFPFQAARIQ